MKQFKRSALILLLAALFLAGCGGKNNSTEEKSDKTEKTTEAEATTMRLEKTEGSVTVTDSDQKGLELKEKLPLYDGYLTETQSDSFAWINLDDAKLAKLDMDSRALINKEERHLKLTAEQGSLFFNITEPLEDDEAMDIQVGTMVVGIRGTCGWVDFGFGSPAVCIIEGTVTCELEDSKESVQVSGGQMAQIAWEDNSNALKVKSFSKKDIPEYVLPELDDALLSLIPEHDTYTLPLSTEDLDELMRAALNEEDSVISIQAGEGDNTMVIDNFLTIYGTVIFEEGVTLTINEDAQVNVDGTLELRSDLTNDGTLCILEDGVLQTDGSFTNNSIVFNGDIGKGGMEEGPEPAQNSRIIAQQGITNNSSFLSVGYVEGTITQNGGALSLMAGNVDAIVLNGGQMVDDGGSYGNLTNNGGHITSAAQGYR
jgi:hypothetical protein